MMIKRYGGALALWCAAATAWAGGSAQVEVRDEGDVQQITYEYRGGDVRMGLPQGAEGYMLVTGGVPYAVMTGEQTLVLDMRQSLRMMGNMMSAPDLPGAHGFVSLRSAGRNETVAGVTGQVHVLTYREDGQQRTEEVVLSRDARAVAFTQAMFDVSKAMVAASGVSPGDEAEFLRALNGQGMLRFGQQFRVTRLDGTAPAASRFALPAAPTQMPNLEGMFGAGAGAGGAGTEASGSGGVDFGGLFGGKAARQQQRVEGRAEQEVDSATDQAVDKVLDKTFKKLFGR